MNKQHIILVVVAILFLSMGPLSYLIDNDSGQVIEYNPIDEGTPHFYRVSATIDTKVVDMEPFINFVFVSPINDDGRIRAKINEITEDYELSVTFNPSGEGYQYRLSAPVNASKMQWTGFKLSYALTPYIVWEQSNLPTAMGKIRFPAAFFAETGQGNQTIRTDNDTISAILLYSQKANGTAPIVCNDIITSLNYKMTGVQSVCYDDMMVQMKPYLGLPLEYALFPNESSRIVDARLEGITNATITGKFHPSLGINATQFYGDMAIENESFEMDMRIKKLSENVSSFVFFVGPPLYSQDGYVPYQTLQKIQLRIESVAMRKNMEITRKTANGIISFSDTVELHGAEYKLPVDRIRSSVPYNAIPGKEFQKSLAFNLVFGEIIDIRESA